MVLACIGSDWVACIHRQQLHARRVKTAQYAATLLPSNYNRPVRCRGKKVYQIYELGFSKVVRESRENIVGG